MDIVLVEPEIAGNIGAVARSMKNFGFKKLILVNPQADPKSEEAICRAKNAQEVLKKAKIVSSLDKLKYDTMIGTSGKLGSDYNIARTPTTPRELAEEVSHLKKTKIALCFGRESHGLTNEELEQMDYLVHIPSNDAYPVLNLSHAVTILLYELAQSQYSETLKDQFKPLSKKDKDILLSLTDEILDNLEFQRESKKETQHLLWKKLIAKSFLSRREGFSLMGFLRKILKKL
jgi:tRNA/rRNA methyltransferase